MIVRIMADNQYELGDEHLAEVQRIDDELDRALDRDDNVTFQSALRQLTDFVQQHGQLIADDDLRPSDLIVPASDMTLAEARQRLHPVATPPDAPATE